MGTRLNPILLFLCFTMIFLTSCNGTDSRRDQQAWKLNEKKLNELMQTWGFTMARLPREWRPIVTSPKGKCVLGWKKDDAIIHMYIYDFMHASFVLKQISGELPVKTNVKMENHSLFSQSITGISGNIFTKYVVIPSRTGRDTFAFSYLEKVFKSKQRPRNLNYADVERLSSQLPELKDFNAFIRSFRLPHPDLIR